MKNDKNSAENRRACRESLSTERNKCAELAGALLAKQLSGDFTAETARKLNLLNYKIEVLKNRLNGKFDNDYRNEIEFTIPKTQRK
jgi:hypothetical protein